MHKVFISYVRDDERPARLIADRLASVGISVFFDASAIVAGEYWSERIKTELIHSNAVLVLLSSNSRRSAFVEDEVQAAIETKKLVIPVLLDEKATQNWLWPLLATRQSIRLDLSSEKVEEQLSSLVDVLRSSYSGSTSPFGLDRVRQQKFSVWKALALSVVSAAAGALAAWLAR